MYSKVANFILSNKHNTALPGEKHQVIYLPDGTYNAAVYSGPGTNLEVRLTRGDQPLSSVDKEAQAHDIRYLLANTEDDVKKADETMINKLNDVRARGLDSSFNINQAELIRLKYYANQLGVPTSFFTSFGHGDSQAEQDLIPIAEKKLQELEQEGYGKVRPKRLYKDDKGYYNKNSNSGVKQYLKTGSNKSGRDLYIINMNNPKAVPKPRVKKGEGENGDKSKLTKMIPSANDIRTSGSSSNIGVPSTKQEVVNAYNEGMNRTRIDQYKGLLDKYKDLEKQIGMLPDEDLDKAKLQKEKDIAQKAIDQYDIPADERQQAEYENLTNYSGDISKPDNLPSLLRPNPMPNDAMASIAPSTIRSGGESIAGIGTNNASTASEVTTQSSDSFNASSDMGSSFSPSTDSDMGSIKAESEITQPVIEPVIETESLMPIDNTPDFTSTSAIEAKLNEKIQQSELEPPKLSPTIMEMDDKEKINKIFNEFYDEKAQKRDFVRALRYDTLTQMDKTQKQNDEAKSMSFEDLSSARKLNTLESKDEGVLKTEKPQQDGTPASREAKQTFTHFSQIKTPTRKIKILLGEYTLNDGNRRFLEDTLKRIPPSGRITSKTLSSVDKETIDLLWNEYSNSILTFNQKDIIAKYLSQTGFGLPTGDIDKNGLTTSHIEDMMKKYDHINLSVIASDEILELKKGLQKASNKLKLLPFIMNLDPSDKPGSHWVAVVIDNRDKYVGYYDSLCIHPTKQILDDIKELVKMIDPVHMFKFKFNTVRDQSKHSGKCGMYSMQFLHNILNGMSFKKASGYYDRDYEDGEHKLMSGFGFL